MARALYGDGQAALMFGAGACLAAWPDLPAIRQVTAQEIGVLIRDFDHLIQAEIAYLRQITPGNHVVPLEFFAAFTLGTRPATACDNAKAGYRSSARRVAHFWIAAQVSDYHDFIQSPAHNDTP